MSSQFLKFNDVTRNILNSLATLCRFKDMWMWNKINLDSNFFRMTKKIRFVGFKPLTNRSGIDGKKKVHKVLNVSLN